MAILFDAARKSKASTFALQFCGAVALSGCVDPLKHVVTAPITRAFIGQATKSAIGSFVGEATRACFRAKACSERDPGRGLVRATKTHQKSESLRSD
jgi:hypothetical protein